MEECVLVTWVITVLVFLIYLTLKGFLQGLWNKYQKSLMKMELDALSIKDIPFPGSLQPDTIREDAFFDRLFQNTLKSDLVSELNRLTSEQVSLQQQLQAPSKNALHSKYKNQLFYASAELERQKHIILGIIKDKGFDILLQDIMPDGTRKPITIEEYIDRTKHILDYTLDKDTSPSVPSSKDDTPKKPDISIVNKGNLKVINNHNPIKRDTNKKPNIKIVDP